MMTVRSFRSAALRPQLPCHDPTSGWPSWADDAGTVERQTGQNTQSYETFRRINPPQRSRSPLRRKCGTLFVDFPS